ncbi:hypothetical protein EVAR_48533_1 [Eumeta japonica]|uniref:Uncharacterized protein n=1 Tax=Eumeta variegata TaxID=151549 RepID=A0A4C1YAI6_EUMVA|nr:hypothetical protein EVAR_48533_1 [Eumeta japonica]
MAVFRGKHDRHSTRLCSLVERLYRLRRAAGGHVGACATGAVGSRTICPAPAAAVQFACATPACFHEYNYREDVSIGQPLLSGGAAPRNNSSVYVAKQETGFNFRCP